MTTMKCSACAGQTQMMGVSLAPGLIAQQCDACEGAVVSMDDYRKWRDELDAQTHPLPDIVIHGLLTVEDSVGARACPHCQRVMQRLRVTTELPNFRIDRCVTCQLVWFDRGEWAALAHNGLARRLDEVLTDGWQRKLQQDTLRAGREAALRLRHGDACIDELTRIRSWLALQPQRDELLAMLSATW